MKEKNEIKLIYLDHRGVKWVYFIFQGLIVLTMIGSIISIIINPHDIENQISHIFLCVIAILLFNIPLLLKTKYKIYIPSIIQVGALIFIYCHFVLGEIFRLYDYSMFFDKILHTTSGIALTIFGFSVINLLNRNSQTYLKLTPFLVAFFSFCFSLALALLWEVFEFVVDSLFGANMQRWQVTEEQLDAKAYDLGRFGLKDTMYDMIVATIGSTIVSIVGYISLKTKNDILNRVMFRRFVDFEQAIEDAKKVGDERMVKTLLRARDIQNQRMKSQKAKKKEAKKIT